MLAKWHLMLQCTSFYPHPFLFPYSQPSRQCTCMRWSLDSLMILILVALQDPLQSLWLRVPAGREPGVQCDCHVLSVVRQYEDQH